MKQDFSGKAAMVTGGGSGIGRVTALAFAEAGAAVAVVDRDLATAQTTADEIVAAGGKALALRCDVTSEQEVSESIKQVVTAFGRLDCAFNNAGIGGTKGVPTQDLGLDEWQRIVAVNLTSVFLCMKHEIAAMAKQGGGTIVNTSSTAGVASAVNSGVAYAASKHGVVGLTKTAAKENLESGIRINAICPAGVATPLLEQTIGKEMFAAATAAKGRIAEPEDISDAVLWLSSPASAFVNGQALVLDGGRIL